MDFDEIDLGGMGNEEILAFLKKLRSKIEKYGAGAFKDGSMKKNLKVVKTFPALAEEIEDMKKLRAQEKKSNTMFEKFQFERKKHQAMKDAFWNKVDLRSGLFNDIKHWNSENNTIEVKVEEGEDDKDKSIKSPLMFQL